MSDLDDLDALSSRELHDLAVRRARHHLDVTFLWDLLRALPVGEAIAGHPDHAEADALHLSALIGDAIDADDSDVVDALRPFYLDYLRKHRKDLPDLPAAGGFGTRGPGVSPGGSGVSPRASTDAPGRQ